jgi:hypothetical protein
MAERPDQPEYLLALSDLPESCLVSTDWLAEQLNRGEEAIRRAITRKELPPPFALCSKQYWTIGHLRDFFLQRAKAFEASPAPMNESLQKATRDTERHTAKRYISPLRKV